MLDKLNETEEIELENKRRSNGQEQMVIVKMRLAISLWHSMTRLGWDL